jgi:hypothetical protein
VTYISLQVISYHLHYSSNGIPEPIEVGMYLWKEALSPLPGGDPFDGARKDITLPRAVKGILYASQGLLAL